MTVTRKWSLLAAVLVVAIVAAGWFLMIAPKRSEAADLKDKAVSQQEANQQLRQKIQQLQAMQADLPAQRAKLAVMRTRIPTNPALPSLIRDLTAAGRKTGVSLDTLAPSTPVAVVQEAPATPVAVTGTSQAGTGDATSTDSSTSSSTDSTTDSSTTSSSTAGTTSPPAAAVPPAPNLFQVPLNVTVTGSYFELEQFVNKLEQFKRSLLVAGFTLGEATSDDAAEGDLQLVLQGRVFLSPPAAEAAATTPTTPAASSATAQ